MKTRPTLQILLCLLPFSFLFGQSVVPLDYSQAANWAENHTLGKQLGIDPSYTIIGTDTNVRTVVNLPYDTSSAYDIFCLYPTYPRSDPSPPAISPFGTHPDTIDPIITGLFSNFGQFGRIYAPYYRQVNLRTMTSNSTSKATQADLLATPAADVAAAFAYYMDNCNNGKSVILVGHSQGAILLAGMLRQLEASNSPYLNQIFLSVLPGLSAPWVQNGSTSGGFFDQIPVCQDSLDVNCVMVWQTYRNYTSMGVNRASHHIYNDSLAARGFRFTAFDTNNQRVLMDPLRFSTPKDISLTFFPHDNHYSELGVSYNGVATSLVAYENMFNAVYDEVTTDAGIRLTKNLVQGGDDRKRPSFWNTAALLLDGNHHNWDLLSAGGDVADLIWLKINNSVGLEEAFSLPRVKVASMGSGFELSLAKNKENLRLQIHGLHTGVVFEKEFVDSVFVDMENLPAGIYFYRIFGESSRALGSGKVMWNHGI